MSELPNIRAAKPILIFPAGMPLSLDYLEKCRREGQPIIGASSLAYDVAREHYPLWSYLPYITEPDFNDALKKAIATFDIGSIYTPNQIAWNYLKRELKNINPDIALINDSPVNDALSVYRIATQRAAGVLRTPLQLGSPLPPQPSISELELATLFRHANVIAGMCDDEKISALCEVARRSPPGDVVEIGSWWGKSAFVLARLAQCYRIGATLCVDPWSNSHLAQNDAGGLVDSSIEQYDCDEALRVFEMNLLPYSSGDINYLRMPSTDGAQHYRSHASATTASFGTTPYCGRIAVLHIDGNHRHDAVQADVAAWCGLVMDGGWIVFDDYVWPYGDGPQLAGDAFLMQHRERIAVSFVIGSALFIQLTAGLPANTDGTAVR